MNRLALTIQSALLWLRELRLRRHLATCPVCAVAMRGGSYAYGNAPLPDPSSMCAVGAALARQST